MMDSELQSTKLCQAEAVDNIGGLRFVSFGIQTKLCGQQEYILRGTDSEAIVGTCRCFWLGETGQVMFIVTLDYASPDRLALENDYLGLRVTYQIHKIGFDPGLTPGVDVYDLEVSGAELVRMPPGLSVSTQPYSVVLPLRPAKTWRWA